MLDDVLSDVEGVVERSPLESVVAVGIGERDGGAVVLDEALETVEIAVGRSGEDVCDGRRRFGGGLGSVGGI